MKLPINYKNSSLQQRRKAREEYIEIQKQKCFFCKSELYLKPPKEILDYKINWSLFPKNFLKYPIHLQHDHNTGLTEGAVHAYCNAVWWQYKGR